MTFIINPLITTLSPSGGHRVFIGYENLFLKGAVGASSEAAGYEITKGIDGFTNRKWKGDAGAGVYNINVNLSSIAPANYFAIYSHNLHEVGGSVIAQVSFDGGTVWNDVTNAYAPSTSAPIMRRFGKYSAADWRLQITTTGGAPIIGNIMLGNSLELVNGLKLGWEHPFYSSIYEETSLSNSQGEVLTSTIKIKPCEFRIESEFYSPAWIEANWMPFIRHIELGNPFYLAPRADTHPHEIIFCRKTGSIPTPSFTSSARVKIELPCKGFIL